MLIQVALLEWVEWIINPGSTSDCQTNIYPAGFFRRDFFCLNWDLWIKEFEDGNKNESTIL